MASNSNQRPNSSGSRRTGGQQKRRPQQSSRSASSARAARNANSSARTSHVRPEPIDNTQRSDRGKGDGKHHGGKILKRVLVAIVAVAAALGIAWVVLSRTSLFEITAIEVQSSSRLTDSYLTSTAAVSKGTNLLNVDTGEISKRLSQSPWISSVSVHRNFPHTLVLDIHETTPVAVVEIAPTTSTGSAQYWLISSDGVWMSQVTADGVAQARAQVIYSTDVDTQQAVAQAQADSAAQAQAEAQSAADGATQTDETQSSDSAVSESTDQVDSAAQTQEQTQENAEPSICADVYYTVSELAQIPIITDVQVGVVATQGEQTQDEGILNAINIIKNSTDDFGAQIATITSTSGDSTSVILKSGVEVAFGDATDMDTKIQEVKSLLEQYPDQIAYINVRVPSRPTWRGL